VVAVKVWLGGEGPSEIGTRADGGDAPGVLEALLLRLEPTGWRVDGAQRWKYIRKYRAGHAARGGENHEDMHNVLGLALAFTRDVDADARRASAVERGIEQAKTQFVTLSVIGGVANPAIEGWVIACLGVRGTDDMSRVRTLELLRERDIDEKSHAAYVAIVTEADLARLPPGCGSLNTWLSRARATLARVLRGERP
jgi:hypothetical protein